MKKVILILAVSFMTAQASDIVKYDIKNTAENIKVNHPMNSKSEIKVNKPNSKISSIKPNFPKN